MLLLAQADAYSFGVMCWECFKNESILEGKSIESSMNVVDRKRTMPQNMDGKLADLVARCLDRDVAVRPRFAEIIPVLENLVATAKDQLSAKVRSHVGDV